MHILNEYWFYLNWSRLMSIALKVLLICLLRVFD